jgi:DNA mismatch repair protein MutS
MVQFFVEAVGLREAVRGLLKRCPDLERALSRLSLGRGGPRDLAAVRDALGRSPARSGRCWRAVASPACRTASPGAASASATSAPWSTG